MRIITGEAKGRRLIAPKGMETRPTADKTRESLFSILMRYVGDAKVLDLFGGTGALALEAISRGAQSAVICDVSDPAIKAIRANALAVTKDDGRVRVFKADYKAALERLKTERFDLVFLDPPYRLSEAYAYSARFLLENGMLNEDAIVAAERSTQLEIAWPKGLTKYDTRQYRDTAIDFLRRDTDEQGTEE